MPGIGYAGFQSPDIVANLRVDQAWGSAQIMGALHQVATTYYDFNTVNISMRTAIRATSGPSRSAAASS